ncbi:MAG TPA: phosphotransferase [Desulfatiglandales bacterium]|nr:phosphotransferase [Desulfatiglandales bacterium]
MASIVDDLSNPASLPDDANTVSVIQTHISIVFLADEFVYKIKKPVNFGFLDFSTLEKRHYYCQQEITLNRRLCKDVYLAVLPILYDGKIHKIAQGKGRVAEYAVKMKRLPDEMIMKSLLSRGELEVKHLEKLSKLLAKFHLTTENSKDIDKYGEPEIFAVNTDENFAQTEKYISITIRNKDFKALKTWTADFYHTHDDLFWKRIEAKKIRDCHGDLHMDHICFGDDLCIFDCIEFNDRLRYTDPLADIGFLMMDLEYHEGSSFSKQLWELYKKSAGETEVDILLNFYKVYRAYVRGKVTSFQLDDENIGSEKKEVAVKTAKRYFELASSYIR